MGIRDWQPEKVKKAHILKAARIWDRRAANGNDDHPFFKHNFRQSIHFDVFIGGRRYPPKAISSCAHGLATGRYLPTSEFAGANNGLWHRRLKELGFSVVEKQRGQLSPGKASVFKRRIEEDIDNIFSEKIKATQRKALIDARIGQGRFRRDVLKLWNKGCAVTGCKTVDAIRASHIKPWHASDDDERLDPYNGLPLIATLDALFDRNLISFTSSGMIIISKAIEKEISTLSLNKNMRLQGKLTVKQKDFLTEHRLHLI